MWRDPHTCSRARAVRSGRSLGRSDVNLADDEFAFLHIPFPKHRCYTIEMKTELCAVYLGAVIAS